MGIQGRGPKGGGRIIPPAGGSVMAPPGTGYPPRGKQCQGCGAPLRQAECEYCGRMDPDPKWGARPRIIRR